MIKAFTYLLFTASLVIAVQLWAEAQPEQEQNDYSMICDHPDYDVLMALYQSTNGANWTNNTGWEAGASASNCTPCDWYGIDCEEGRVIEVNLNGNNLNGSIPNSIHLLENLRELDLSNNSLFNEIPGEISFLLNLEYLSLSNNALSGDIPTVLGDMGNLFYLDLSSNLLVGDIPYTFDNLEYVEYISLANNQLIGSIPDELGSLSQLRQLFLFNNNFTGVLPANLNQVTHLYVQNNELSFCVEDVFNTYCSLGYSENMNLSGYNLTGNTLLPWEGDLQRYCNGEATLAAYCNDLDEETINDTISVNCLCEGFFIGCQPYAVNYELSDDNICAGQSVSLSFELDSELAPFVLKYSENGQDQQAILTSNSDSIIFSPLATTTYELLSLMNADDCEQYFEDASFDITVDYLLDLNCIVDGTTIMLDWSPSMEDSLLLVWSGPAVTDTVVIESGVTSYSLPVSQLGMYTVKLMLADNDCIAYCETIVDTPPENDDCATAMLLNIEPVIIGNGVDTTTFFLHNVGALPQLDFEPYYDCRGEYIDAVPTDVWYKFRAKTNEIELQLLGLNNASVALFLDEDCANLIPIGCTRSYAGNDTLSFSFKTNINQEYLFYVSGRTLEDQANFMLDFISKQTDCRTRLDLISPTAMEDLIVNEGDTLELCYAVSYWYTPDSHEWLHGIEFDFGAGWDLSYLETQAPDACNTNGEWGWYNEWQSCYSNQTFGPGFGFDSNAGLDVCDSEANDGDPGNNWGDCNEIEEGELGFNFCLTLKVDTLPEEPQISDLELRIKLLADQISGSWPGEGCNAVNLFETTIYRACPHPDYELLINLYTHTDGENWTYSGTASEPESQNSGWGKDCEPCNWYGVQCNEDGRVTCIDLDGTVDCMIDEGATTTGNSLAGEFPSLFEKTSFLEFLDLSHNNISGELPDSVYHSSNLKNLAVNNNLLVGELGVGLMNFSQIEYLLLNDNQLKGCYPEAFEDWLCESAINYDFNNNFQLPWTGDFQQICLGEDNYGAACDNDIHSAVDGFINQNCECQNIETGCDFYEASFEYTQGYVCLGDSIIISLDATGGQAPYNLTYTLGFIDQSTTYSATITEEEPLILRTQQTGTYTLLSLRDSIGCEASMIGGLSFNITTADELGLSCEADELSIDLSWEDNGAPYTVYWTGTTNGSAQVDDNFYRISDLGLGAYDIRVQNVDGCESYCVAQTEPSSTLINDDCETALTLDISGSLNQTLTFELNNYGATPQDIEVPYFDCHIIDTIQTAPTDVWYRFTAIGYTTRFEIENLNASRMALFLDDHCDALTFIGCASRSSDYLQTTLNTVPGQDYMLFVSGGTANDESDFILGIRSSLISSCELTFDTSVTPSEENLLEGDSVEICFTISERNGLHSGWLHALEIQLGNGWDHNSLAPSTFPTSCDSAGVWGWYEEWDACLNGLSFGPGFAYDSNTGIDCEGSEMDGDPGNNSGDGLGDCFIISAEDGEEKVFCWTAVVGPRPIQTPFDDLKVIARVLSDKKSGNPQGGGAFCNKDVLCFIDIERAPCPHPDYEALMDFYEIANGHHWIYAGTASEPESQNSGWGKDCEPCNWYGVQCNEEGRVVCIDLDGNVNCMIEDETADTGNNLTGYIAEEIGNLPFLQFLDLSSNALSGQLPTSLGNLTHLESLSLANNELTASIPNELSNLSQLKELLLFNNQLTGALPSDLDHLTHLYLQNNELSFCVEDVFSNYCALGYSGNANVSGYNLTGNVQLAWEGDLQNYCNGMSSIGVYCNDLQEHTMNDLITDDCLCEGECLPFTFTYELNTQENCNGLHTLTLDYLIDGGSPPYLFNYGENNQEILYSNDSTLILSTYLDTSYTINSIVDANNCEATIVNPNFDLTAAVPPLELRAFPINHAVLLTWNDYQGSYTINWDGPDTGEIEIEENTYELGDLTTGAYTIHITRQDGCMESVIVEVTGGVNNNDCTSPYLLELSDIPCNAPVEDTVSFYLSNLTASYSEIGAQTSCDDESQMTDNVADAWYRFTAKTSLTSFEIEGLEQARIVVYPMVDCSEVELLELACVSSNDSSLELSVETLVGIEYLLAISGNNNDQDGFKLNIISEGACMTNTCNVAMAMDISPSEHSLGYEEGELVELCYTIYHYGPVLSGTIDWLHAVEMKLGQGWNLNSLQTIPPPSCNGLGEWAWYDQWTSCSTGDSFGPGFAYDSNQGVDCGGQINDGDPGNNWGDGSGNEDCSLIRPENPRAFCFSLEVGSVPDSIGEPDLSIVVKPLTDGESGSWTVFGDCFHYSAWILPRLDTICLNTNFTMKQTLSNPSCNQNNGSISIATAGGLAPYTYNWSNGDSGPTIDSLAAGEYTVSVMDANACDTILTINLEAEDFDLSCPQDRLYTIATDQNNITLVPELPLWTVGCDATTLLHDISYNDNLLEQAVEGLVGSYTFNIGVNTLSYYQIGGDTCSFNIIVEQEQENCASFAIDAMNVVDPACANNDGFISIVATGGTAPYHYLWSNDSTTASIYNLAAGDYTVSVSDANDCEQTMSFNLVAADALSLSCEQTLLASDYDMADGAAHLGFSGGTQPYTLSVNGEVTTGIFTNIWDLENLNAGFYDIVLQDANNCSTGCTLLIQVDDACDGIDLELTGNLSICENGYTLLTISGADLYYWSVGADAEHVFINEEGTYYVIGSTLDGCEDTLFFEITTMPAPSIELEGVTMVCEEDEATISVSGASNYLWSTASTAAVEFLPVGTHQVIGWSAEGCSDTLDVVIEEIPTPIVSITGDTTVCGDGLTQITASGADYYEWSTGEQDSILSLAAGTYEVEGRTAEDCYAEVLSFTIHSTDLPLIPADYTADYIACTDEAIDIDIALQENQTFNWYTANGFFITQGDVLYNYDVPNDYWVEVLDLETGCVSSQRALIHVLADEQAPVLSNCPVDTTLMLNTSVTPEVLYAWQDPDVIDNCGSVVLSSSHTSPAAFTTDQLITYTATDQAGNVANCSFTVNIVRTDSLAFYVDTTDLVYYGDTLEVGLGVVAMDDISAWQLALSLSNLVGSEFIDIVELHPALGNTLVDELYDSNEGISLRWNELDGSSNANLSLADSTLLLRLRMKVGGNYGDCLDVNFDIDHLNPMAYKTDIGSVSVNTEDRVVCRPTTASIAGYVLKENYVSVADVALRLHQSSTTDTLTTLTNTEGYYQFDDVTLGQDYSLSAFRDGDDSNGVDLVDITLMRSDYLYGTPVYEYLTSAYKVIAADITKNDTFGVEDLSAGVYLLLNDEFPADVNNTSWRFVNEDYLFPDMRAPWNPMIPEIRSIVDLDRHELEEDFVGVKIADIDLNANTAFVANVALSLEDKEYEAGEILYVPIHLASVEHIEALSFELEANGLEFVAVDYENRAFGQLFSSTNKKTGKLRAVYLANEHIGRYAESDIIAILKYKAKRAGRLSHSLSLSQDTKRQMAVNNRLQALELDLVYRQESNSTSAHLDKQDEVLSVYPNPFDEQLYFALNLTQAQELELVIYDVSAKEVMRIREEMPAGLQNWQLNTQLLEHAGMYFYELKTTTNTHKGFVIKH